MYFEHMQLKKYKNSTKKISKHVVQSANVLNTRKKLIAEKENIIELHNSNDSKKLGEALAPLIESQNKSLLLGYSYSVDDEIDAILDEYLRENKRVKLANKIKKLKVDF